MAEPLETATYEDVWAEINLSIAASGIPSVYWPEIREAFFVGAALTAVFIDQHVDNQAKLDELGAELAGAMQALSEWRTHEE